MLTQILGGIIAIVFVIAFALIWFVPQNWGNSLFVFAAAIALFLLVAAVSINRITTRRRLYDVYHLTPNESQSLLERANHEDILHSRRLGIFLSFEAFLGIALGVSGPLFPKIVFSLLGFFVGMLWIFWSGNATVCIRTMRDARARMLDEALWNQNVRGLDERIGPLDIFNVVVPVLLCLAWVLILFIMPSYGSQGGIIAPSLLRGKDRGYLKPKDFCGSFKGQDTKMGPHRGW